MANEPFRHPDEVSVSDPAPSPPAARALARRAAPLLRRHSPRIVAGSAAGAFELLATPPLIQWTTAVPVHAVTLEAAGGLLAGAALTGAVEMLSGSDRGHFARTAGGGLAAAGAAAGILEVGLRAMDAPHLLAAVPGTGAVVLMGGAAVVGAATYPYFNPAATDIAAARVRASTLRRIGVWSLVPGAAGAAAAGVATVLGAVTGFHPYDASLIDFLAVAGTSASVVPLAGSAVETWRVRRAERALA